MAPPPGFKPSPVAPLPGFKSDNSPERKLQGTSHPKYGMYRNDKTYDLDSLRMREDCFHPLRVKPLS